MVAEFQQRERDHSHDGFAFVPETLELNARAIIYIGSGAAAIGAALWYFSTHGASAADGAVSDSGGQPAPADEPAPTIGESLENFTVTAESAVGVSWPYPRGAEYANLFQQASDTYNIPAGLLAAQGWQESRYRADIIDGTTRSSAGAVGIMQIIPRFHPEIGEAGALDPSIAVPYAAKYLAGLAQRFGSWSLALAAYNWGPGNLDASPDPATWPAETKAYVASITSAPGVNVA